jgi:hypothetical protein
MEYSIKVPKKSAGGRPARKDVFNEPVREEDPFKQLDTPLFLFLGYRDGEKSPEEVLMSPSPAASEVEGEQDHLGNFLKELDRHAGNHSRKTSKNIRQSALAAKVDNASSSSHLLAATQDDTNKPDHEILEVSL